MIAWGVRGCRGGLSTLVSALVLIILVLAGLIGLSLYYSIIVGGTLQPGLILKAGTGISAPNDYVYLNIYNAGMGGSRITMIVIDDAYAFTFSGTHTCAFPGASACAINGNPSVGVSDSALYMPAGMTVSLRASSCSSGIPFHPGTFYKGMILSEGAPDQPFTIYAW